MEAATLSEAGAGEGTGSSTVADLLPLAAERYGDAPAVMWKEPGGEWVSDVQVWQRRGLRARRGQ